MGRIFFMFWIRMDRSRPLEVDIEVIILDVDIIVARKLMGNPYLEKLGVSNPDLNVSEEIEES